MCFDPGSIRRGNSLIKANKEEKGVQQTQDAIFEDQLEKEETRKIVAG